MVAKLQKGVPAVLPLNEPIHTTCRCCGLRTRVILRTIADSPACRDCKAHRSEPDVRDATHRRLWSALAQRIDKGHKAKRAELEARIVEVEGQNEESKTTAMV